VIELRPGKIAFCGLPPLTPKAIVHRDIKPANIGSKEGQRRIKDFSTSGLALAQSPERTPPESVRCVERPDISRPSRPAVIPSMTARFVQPRVSLLYENVYGDDCRRRANPAIARTTRRLAHRASPQPPAETQPRNPATARRPDFHGLLRQGSLSIVPPTALIYSTKS